MSVTRMKFHECILNLNGRTWILNILNIISMRFSPIFPHPTGGVYRGLKEDGYNIFSSGSSPWGSRLQGSFGHDRTSQNSPASKRAHEYTGWFMNCTELIIRKLVMISVVWSLWPGSQDHVRQTLRCLSDIFYASCSSQQWRVFDILELSVIFVLELFLIISNYCKWPTWSPPPLRIGSSSSNINASTFACNI